MKSRARAVAAVVWAFVLTGGVALTAAPPASAVPTPPRGSKKGTSGLAIG